MEPAVPHQLGAAIDDETPRAGLIVRLEASDITRLRELVTDAWHMRAPAELEVEHPLLSGEGDR